MPPYKKHPNDEPPNPWHDRTSRFPFDQVLRKHGFHVVSRPLGREPMWEKAGVLYYFSDALTEVPQAEIDDAELIQEIYFDQWDD